MRAVLIWNSGLVKNNNCRRREGGGRGQYCWGFALRWAGTYFAGVTVQHVSAFGIWGTGMVVEGGGGGSPQMFLTWRGLIGGVIEEKRVSWGEWQRALRLSLRDIL